MATNLEIANQALFELGSSPITSDDFTTPVSASAKVVSSAFSSVLNEVLSDYDFPILRNTAALVTDETPDNLYTINPAAGAQYYLQPIDASEFSYGDTRWTYSFDLSEIPNFGFLRKVTDPSGNQVTDYALEGNRLQTDITAVFVAYTKTITDASELPEYIIPAIIYKLAARIAKPLTGEINEREFMNREYEKAFKRAKRRASQEKVPMRYIQDSNSSYIQAHQGPYGHL